MDARTWGIGLSLLALSGLLVALFVRDVRQYLLTRSVARLGWGGGLALAAAAMATEGAVYFGFVNTVLLQAYVFFSAAIVGVLSLGALRVLQRPLLRKGYAAYTVATTAIVAAASFLTPLPAGMVSGGIISGSPGPLLLVLSSFVTVPATAVLLLASALSLRRHLTWQALLLVSGALILGAGGTLYIASFPVALYYAEFAGIVLLFFGIVSLPQPSAAPVAAPARSQA